MNYLQYVNLLIGTNSVKSYSNGNTTPIAAMPFGMNTFTVETRCDSDFLFFNPQDHHTTGIRLTHQLSPWLGDYGAMTFLPTSGDTVDFKPTVASGFIREKTVFEPNRLKIEFLRYQTQMELVPTMRGAAGSLIFPKNNTEKRLFINLQKGVSELKIDAENGIIKGFVTNKILNHTLPQNFKEFFIIKLSSKINIEKTAAICNDETEQGKTEFSGNDLRVSLCFNTEKSEVNYSLATSYISYEQAKQNLNAEIGEKSAEELYNEGEKIWNERLSKIEIETDDEEQLRTFYSCMWRANLFPHTFHEITTEGEKIHYSPANGEVLSGPFYADMGFWDVYRTAFPLMTIIDPEMYKEICLGLIDFYKESGWLPRFSAPGPISCMPGTAIDMVFADAAKKGIVTDENSLSLMLEGMIKHATTPCDDPKLGGRDGIADYLKLGFVPLEYRESVNKTLDYAYGDFCISIIADALGKDDIAKEYKNRALNYKNIFDAETNLLKARDKSGNPRIDWKEFEWSFDYTEGSAWQNSFSVFHDMAGHASLMGGKAEMIKMIDKLFALPPIFEVGYRGKEIHEMTEMASVDFGQCALSNQPSFHIPYIYSYMGEPDKTCYQVRRAVKELFNSGINGYPGDEDTGSMSAWYILSTLGFYPFTPATGEYVLAAPSVKKAIIHTGYGNDFIIEAENFGKDNIYAAKITENGSELDRTYITHQSIKEGMTLKFTLTNEPTGKAYNKTPFSLSK